MIDKLMQTFERLVIAVIVLALLPCLAGALVRAIGTFNLVLILAILGAVAYLRRGSKPPSAGGRRGGHGAERTPLLPGGGL
jgi:hypothetical protein